MITKKDIAKLEGLLMLVAVSENNSKKKVAEALNLSVDTLNKYISDLEKELGTKLVTSNGRGSVLTYEAQNIINLGFDIKKVVRSVDTLLLIRMLCREPSVSVFRCSFSRVAE